MDYFKKMREAGWQPIEIKSCVPRVDIDGRPIVIFAWLRTSSK